MNIAEKLLAGSNEISRMQTDIHKCVNMLTSAVFEIERGMPFQDLQDTLQMVTLTVSWKIIYTGRDLRVECYVGESYGMKSAYSNRNKYYLTYEVAQRVYEGLPAFVEWMFRLYPKMKERMQPYFDAAVVVEAREIQKAA
jgi:hypothetical protein